MSVKWIDTSRLSFKSLLKLEKIQIDWIKDCKIPQKEFVVALKANFEVEKYLYANSSIFSDYLNTLPEVDINKMNKAEVRSAEIAVMNAINDWLTYVIDPSVYDEQEFLKWDDQELLSLTDFSDRIIADIGAGTGRLAFTVAPKVKRVYCVEPIRNLRDYMVEKTKKLKINNIHIVDGLIEKIPFKDNFADITMAGHVFGDHPEQELAELERITKKKGMIILCPGNDDKDNSTHKLLVDHGFDYSSFEEPKDGMKRKYWRK